MSESSCDILVIGGGINGCGVARDAAGRGFDVVLVEQGDLASGTSSASTKLIHGGLRYLEHYTFRLVREALAEREVLWRMAPHIIWPLRFVLPHHGKMRPAWLLRLGLFLYDHLGGRRLLPPTRILDLRCDDAGKSLQRDFVQAFEYSDAWVQDARLVILNARDACNRGARIHTRTRVTDIQRVHGRFSVNLEDLSTGAQQRITAALVVNAAGPWADQVRRLVDSDAVSPRLRLVQGGHIVVPKLFDHNRCYLFQNADGRIVFAIPYEQDFTLIGTTDRDFIGDPAMVHITQDEIDYLCGVVSDYFRKPVKPTDIVWSYAGVRSLYDNLTVSAQAVTRDYELEQDGDAASGVIIHILGGKVTIYRKLSEDLVSRIEQVLGKRGPAWTANSTLPGGDFPVDGFQALLDQLKMHAPDVAEATLVRLIRHYGTHAFAIIADGTLGRIVGVDLGENEIRYLVQNEWATTAEDILWRRTKLGLRFTVQETEELEEFINFL